MENISGPSQTFFSAVTTISFALFAASRTLDIVKQFHKKEEEYRHLRSISVMALLTTFGAAIPLALSDPQGYVNVRLCSVAFLVLASAVVMLVIFEIVRKQITLIYKRISIFLIASAVAALLALGINAYSIGSLIWYKCAVLWSLALLSVRFYLVLGVYAKSESL